MSLPLVEHLNPNLHSLPAAITGGRRSGFPPHISESSRNKSYPANESCDTMWHFGGTVERFLSEEA